MNKIIRKSMSNLLEYSRENIPYYRDLLMKKNIENNLEEIYKSLPYQDKSVMINSAAYINESMKRPDIDFVEKLTGGTTGEPWCISKTIGEYTRYFSMLWKSRMQFGIQPGDYFYQFGGYGEIDGEYKTQQIIEDTPFTELSLFHLNNEVLDKYIEAITKGKGNWFFANPSALYILALRMKERGLKGIGRIKYVELTGERVYGYQEKIIKEVFNCPVSIMYGSREITAISHRCLFGNNHLLPNLYIEIVDEENNAIDFEQDYVHGQVVITSFIDKYMPFIKYKTGDYATVKYLDSCQCGKKGLVFEELLGRIPVYAEVNGTKVNLEIAYYLMEKFNRICREGINQFQVVFKKPDIFRFLIVASSDDLKDSIKGFYQEELMNVIPDAKVEIRFTDIIDRSKRKFSPFMIEE